MIIITSLILTKKYKLCGYVCLLALIGSDTDSAGLLYGIATFIPYYKLVIRSLTYLIFFISIVKMFLLIINKKIDRKSLVLYDMPIMFSSIFIFLTNMLRGNGLIVSLSELIWLGVPVYFIWRIGSLKEEEDSRKAFINTLTIQALISMIILVGKSKFSLINGANYAHLIGGEAFLYFDSARIVNASISFLNFNKNSYEVMKFAQFHNPNTLGFYSTIWISTAIYLKLERNQLNKTKSLLISSFLLIMGFIGWMNSLTRGPIFMVGMAIAISIIAIIFKPRTYKRVFILFGFLFIITLSLLFFTDLYDYFIIEKNNISLVGRLPGYKYALYAISQHPLFGVEPLITDPVPHILALKLSARYGLFVGILFTVPFIHITYVNIKIFIKDIKEGYSHRNLFNLMLNGIIIGALLTNGIIANIMFWIIFVELYNQSTNIIYGVK